VSIQPQLKEHDAIIADGMQVPASAPSVAARSWVWLAAAALLMVLILAASWAADSRMTQLRWVPRWVAALADRDPNMRTAIPFMPLAFLLARGLAGRGVRRPLVAAMLVCLACVALAEFGQRFLPGRTGDLVDVLWGGAGAMAGTAAAWCVRRGL
jgi:VanZ family protein